MPWRESLTLEQQERKKNNLWRDRQLLDSPQSVEVQRDGRSYLNFCSNDYLGLANHAESINASVYAAKRWGTGSGASHLVCGHQNPHHLLETELAGFVGAEKAILFSTGYMANLAIPQSFLGRNDLLLQDKLNHASLIDSAQLCRANFKRYRHADVQHLQQLIHSNSTDEQRKLISTDSVFSMDGDLAPIGELDALAEKNNAVLLIDDAHGFGILGKNGKGSYSRFGLAPTGHRLMLGTLGKALGSFGAFIAGDAIYIDQIAQQGRTYIYTTALPPSVAEVTRTSLTTVEKDVERRSSLFEAINYFKAGVQQIGLDLMPSETPIQPIMLGDEPSALLASKVLEQQGIWVSAIRPPTVPRGSSRLRVTLTSKHKKTHLDRLLEALSNVKEALDVRKTN